MLAGVEEQHRHVGRDAADEVQQHRAFGAEARYDRTFAEQPGADHARDDFGGILTAEEVVKTDDIGLREARRDVDPVATSFRPPRSAEHTSELPVTNAHLVCRLLYEKQKSVDPNLHQTHS